MLSEYQTLFDVSAGVLVNTTTVLPDDSRSHRLGKKNCRTDHNTDSSRGGKFEYQQSQTTRSESRDEIMDSSTDSDTYLEDEENQSLLSGPMMPLLAVASVAEMQPEADMGAVAVAAAVACDFMER